MLLTVPPMSRPRERLPQCDEAATGLVKRFRVDIALPDLLVALHDFSKPCGARFTDLAASAR